VRHDESLKGSFSFLPSFQVDDRLGPSRFRLQSPTSHASSTIHETLHFTARCHATGANLHIQPETKRPTFVSTVFISPLV
jgi:hypothetical protein